MFPDSKAAQCYTYARSKAAVLVKEIANTETDNIISHIRCPEF